MRKLHARSTKERRTRAQDETFAVLSRGHQTCVDGYIRVDLDAADSETKSFQKLLYILSEISVAMSMKADTDDYEPGQWKRQ